MRKKPLTNSDMQSFDSNETEEKEWERIEINVPIATFRIEVDFWEMKDVARFYYQTDNQFKQLGPDHKVAFKLDHFVGCRFALFSYSTKESGGSAQFSQFKYLT